MFTHYVTGSAHPFFGFAASRACADYLVPLSVDSKQSAGVNVQDFTSCKPHDSNCHFNRSYCDKLCEMSRLML